MEPHPPERGHARDPPALLGRIRPSCVFRRCRSPVPTSRSPIPEQADHPGGARSIAALGGRVSGLKFRGWSGSPSSAGVLSGVLRGQPRAGFAEGYGDVRPRVPLGGYLVNPVTTSQIMDMWVEGRHYRPVATPDSGSVTTVTRRTADPALFPVAKGE